MAIPVEEIEAIIEEAEQGHFSIDDLRDLAAKYRKEETDEAKAPTYTMKLTEPDNIEYLLDMIDSIKNGESVTTYLTWDEVIQRIEAVANNETVTKATMERFGIGRKN